MMLYARKIGTVIKTFLICMVVTFILLLEIFKPSTVGSQQIFDLKSAIVISISFGTSFRMLVYNRNK